VGGAVTEDILVQAAQEFLGAEGWAEARAARSRRAAPYPSRN
jgi:hypothetical protein